MSTLTTLRSRMLKAGRRNSGWQSLVVGVVACGCGESGGGATNSQNEPDDASLPDAVLPQLDAIPEAPDDAAPEVAPDPTACSDLFRQDVLPTYEVEIAPAEWAAVEREFLAGPRVETEPYHPCVFRTGDQSVADAMIRLKGQSSWRDTLNNDQAPKAQFVVAFDQVNPSGKFHGIKKLVFDMPRGDATYLRERLAQAALHDMGVPALCANSGRLVINGTYYGLYATMEKLSGSTLKRLFPEAPDGPLFKGGDSLHANQESFDQARYDAFWAVGNAAEMAQIVDIDATVLEWAGEIVINDGDGYYSGHNYYIYDHPVRGFMWLADDLDATFTWTRTDQHPLFWWKTTPGRSPRWHWVIALSDRDTTRKLVNAVSEALGRYAPATMESRLDAWSAQIATAAAEDPHRPFSMDVHRAEAARLRASFQERFDYLRSWLDCEVKGAGADADGDGLRWCDDCDDRSASVGGIHDGCH